MLKFSDETRFKKWLEACCNPRIQKMDAISVHKRYRVCRRHFDSDCLNGGCRRLLNTAIPTLHLNPSTKTIVKADQSDPLTTARNIIYLPVETHDTEEHFELVLTENKCTDDVGDVKGKNQTNSNQKSIHCYWKCFFFSSPL